jgi:hypothetical protein
MVHKKGSDGPHTYDISKKIPVRNNLTLFQTVCFRGSILLEVFSEFLKS